MWKPDKLVGLNVLTPALLFMGGEEAFEEEGQNVTVQFVRPYMPR